MATPVDAPVAIVGGGVVGAAVAHALARRGVESIVLEAEGELALGASGTNSGILHTAFDSEPGELETRMILRSAALRDAWLEAAGLPVIRCGATLTPRDDGEAATVRRLAALARANGVEAELNDGALQVPGEAVTDPVAYTLALAATSGTELRTGARVGAIERAPGRLALSVEAGGAVACRVAVNCAGLFADAVARGAGDDSGIFPRKGEFFVFDRPDGRPLERILLPVPTAHDQDDKADWSVRPEARAEVLGKARAMPPALDDAKPVASYAGLRPAGRDGANYLIGSSVACPGLVNVAAIRSTGLSASLGIGEHVTRLVARLGIELGPERALTPVSAPHSDTPWWRRTAAYRA